MEESKELKLGDKIYHKSASNIVWVVDKIENGEVHCSTLNKVTLEKKIQAFTIASVVKIEENPLPIIIPRKRSDHWY